MTTLEYSPPAYAVEAPMAERMGQFEDGIYSDLRDYLKQGHRAVSVSMRDLDGLEKWDLAFDADALATVRIVIDGQPTVAVLPLGEVGRTVDAAVRAGATEILIGGPTPQPVIWFGAASGDGYSVLASDPSGAGQLAGAIAPGPKGRSFGDWLQRYAERSGVPQVNQHRERAVDHLKDEYRNAPDTATAIVESIRYVTIVDWFSMCATPIWRISRMGEQLSVPAELRLPEGTVADRIVHEISVEAYGASDPALPTAVDWSQRYTTDAPDPRRPRPPNVIYEVDDADALLERSFGPAQVSSDWSIQHLAPDPTGELVAGVMSLAAPLRASLSDNLDTRRQIAEWRKAGLTDRQLAILFADEIGATDVEIGNALKIARSTVANTLRVARRKIRDFSESE
ncbi:MAG: hypothetical protein ACLQPH_04025 [Acidimicrobiales bacterium]